MLADLHQHILAQTLKVLLARMLQRQKIILGSATGKLRSTLAVKLLLSGLVNEPLALHRLLFTHRLPVPYYSKKHLRPEGADCLKLKRSDLLLFRR